jgi:hypothetical protein
LIKNSLTDIYSIPAKKKPGRREYFEPKHSSSFLRAVPTDTVVGFHSINELAE